MDVHIRDLRYFVAVAEELHFTRAAERLFISQPALSKQIRMLERTFGVTLFERVGPSIRLTAAGGALLLFGSSLDSSERRSIVRDDDKECAAVVAGCDAPSPLLLLSCSRNCQNITSA